MKVIHRIGLRASSSQREQLEALGVKLPAGIALPGGEPVLAFDVAESHRNWYKLVCLFERWNVSDMVRTKFSRREIVTAPWLNLTPEWHCGYPQPDEDTFGYRDATYDLTSYCVCCGVGMRQKAPFQMEEEPKWGHRGILQLHWILGEYFVKPDVWSRVFGPHGIAKRTVINTRGAELRTVVQLVINDEVHIDTSDLSAKACTSCGCNKYSPITRGNFPALASAPTASIAKTTQYFGSGASAHKHILISQALAADFIAAKVRGALLRPMARSST